jgi:hypothetical protein
MYSQRCITPAKHNCGVSASSQMQIWLLREISGICAFPFVLLIKFTGKVSFVVFKFRTSFSRKTLCVIIQKFNQPNRTDYKIMKLLFYLLFIICFSTPMLSQIKIDTSDYYDHYSTGKGLKGTILKTKWLQELEVAQIIAEEMNNAGYKIIRPNRIISLDTNKFVHAIVYSEQSKFGFVYEGIHGVIFKNKDRHIKSNYKTMTGYDYSEKITKLDGTSDFIKVKTLPSNLYLIKEDLYWYQETEELKDNKTLVTREDAIEILRKDVRQILTLAPKPS